MKDVEGVIVDFNEVIKFNFRYFEVIYNRVIICCLIKDS